MNGKPRNEDNELLRNKKVARSNLRAAVQKHNAAESIKENNELMSANFRDPKLFSKLVKKKRVNDQGYNTMHKFDNKEYKGDAQVLASFFKYHNGNSSPPPVSSESKDDMTY